MPANRSANATIKGYFYQFDHTIVQLLSSTSDAAKVDIEGIEDIDLSQTDETAFIQCKYYEGTEYNHSVIKEAVIAMLRHFHGNGCKATTNHKYRVYGHFKSGQDKLADSIALDFLKSKFLTYISDGTLHEVHVELSVTDAQLTVFLHRLVVNIRGDSYSDQQHKIETLFVAKIPGCNSDDVEAFYYPIAINTIQKLAVRQNIAERRISRRDFMLAVNKKDAIFSSWLTRKFGEDHYTRAVKRRYFSPGGTRMPKIARFFVLDLSTDSDMTTVKALLQTIGTKFSHREHKRTPADDRFCPYVLLSGISDGQLIEVKQALLNSGIAIADGYAFNGANFSPARLAAAPTKDHLYKLKFVPSVDQIDNVIAAISGMAVEVFEFHRHATTPSLKLNSTVPHHRILAETLAIIMEAI